MTTMLHRPPDEDPFDCAAAAVAAPLRDDARRRRRRSLAENYVGY